MSLLGALSTVADAIGSGASTGGLNLQLNAGAIAPEAAVLIALLSCLLVDLAGEKAASRWVPPICYAGLGSALVLLALQWNNPNLQPAFVGSFLADNLAIAFRAVVAASTLISLLLSWRYVERSGTPVGEFAGILLAATLGAMFLCGATDLVSIFVSLETLSVSSYLLAGYMKRDARSSEAALKYLLVGSAAAAVFLYGASLLYGITGGGTGLDEVAVALRTSASPVTALALVFVLATVAFKIAAVPFHQWTPDVYEGSPTPVVAFLSVGSKAAGFALALRILVGCFES
ncbi:MAG: proton-conducting transporter membrane subunit, partial [Synechococcus sp.]|nr:proton-conducting transporter membrane subunit [Synechococcus sp.]